MESRADKTMSSAPLPDPARVKAARDRLAAAKISVRRWSRENGETTSLVHKVLSGKRPCILGASRRIAEKLGIVGDDPDGHRAAATIESEIAR